MMAALTGYSLFIVGVLAICGAAFFWSEPLEKWLRKSFQKLR